jgi:hypothetical protein
MAGLGTRFHRVVINDWVASRPAFTAYGGKIQATRFAGGRGLKGYSKRHGLTHTGFFNNLKEPTHNCSCLLLQKPSTTRNVVPKVYD